MNIIRRTTLFVAIVLLIINWLEGSKLRYVKEIRFHEEMFIKKVMVTDNSIFAKVDAEWSIIQFDHEGKILKKYGRIGEGPGEFEFLADFAVSETLLAGVGNRKLCRYKFSGALEGEMNLKMVIFNVFLANEDLYYLTIKAVKQENKQTEYFYHIYDSQNQLLLETPYEGKQRAIHPSSGKRPPFPWFPSPFFNRAVVLPGKNGSMAVFMTQERSFSLMKTGGKIQKMSIDASFKALPVTARDKDEFFAGIIPKPEQRTKQSVEFPETKELFLSVIRWGEGWALVQKDSLVILSYDGKYKERIYFPRQIKENETWGTGRPENFLYRKHDKLFMINNNESISIFKLI